MVTFSSFIYGIDGQGISAGVECQTIIAQMFCNVNGLMHDSWPEIHNYALRGKSWAQPT